MRIVRIEHSSQPYYGAVVDEATVRLWTAAPWLGGTQTDRLVPLGRAKWLPPVEPGKILCVGRNYAAHARELGNEVPSTPLLFLKANTTLLAHGQPILLPRQSERVEHEAELGVVIGQRLKNATPEEAMAGVYGYTCVNDVTARDIQRADGKFTRAKSYDTFCPCGPWIETDFDAASVRVQARVNGDTRQDGTTADMVFPVATLLSFMSEQMTLEPGDLISTGTPEGVGPLTAGDTVQVEVEGLGVLDNPVAADEPS